MAVGGLASLLVALLWTGVVGPTWQTALRGSNARAQQHLALAWQETGVEIANVKKPGCGRIAARSVRTMTMVVAWQRV